MSKEEKECKHWFWSSMKGAKSDTCCLCGKSKEQLKEKEE
jgi:hypothetical protein